MFKLGYSHRAPRCVYEALVCSGFKNIRRQTYTIKGYECLREVATDWIVGVIRVLVTPSLVVAGEAANEAEAMVITERVVREYIAHCRTALPMVNLDMFVAQI